jgi:hypothetical protein
MVIIPPAGHRSADDAALILWFLPCGFGFQKSLQKKGKGITGRVPTTEGKPERREFIPQILQKNHPIGY